MIRAFTYDLLCFFIIKLKICPSSPLTHTRTLFHKHQNYKQLVQSSLMQMWFILLFELHTEKIVSPPPISTSCQRTNCDHAHTNEGCSSFVCPSDNWYWQSCEWPSFQSVGAGKKPQINKETEHIMHFLYFFSIQKRQDMLIQTNQNCHGIIMKYYRDTCLLWNDAYWYKRKESYNFSKTHKHIHMHTMALGG